MKLILISLIALSSFALSQTAHAQVGLTLTQCEAKFGTANRNHGSTPHWNRNDFSRSFTMSVLGHESLQTTAIYAKLDLTHLAVSPALAGR